jgi:hypothetical protein
VFTESVNRVGLGPFCAPSSREVGAPPPTPPAWSRGPGGSAFGFASSPPRAAVHPHSGFGFASSPCRFGSIPARVSASQARRAGLAPSRLGFRHRKLAHPSCGPSHLAFGIANSPPRAAVHPHSGFGIASQPSGPRFVPLGFGFASSPMRSIRTASARTRLATPQPAPPPVRPPPHAPRCVRGRASPLPSAGRTATRPTPAPRVTGIPAADIGALAHPVLRHVGPHASCPRRPDAGTRLSSALPTRSVSLAGQIVSPHGHPKHAARMPAQPQRSTRRRLARAAHSLRATPSPMPAYAAAQRRNSAEQQLPDGPSTGPARHLPSPHSRHNPRARARPATATRSATHSMDRLAPDLARARATARLPPAASPATPLFAASHLPHPIRRNVSPTRLTSTP